MAFVAEIAATEVGRAELFFDVGEHFNARDAVSVAIGDGLTTVRFPLPDVEIRQLRFDPNNTGGRVDVSHPRFEDARGRVVHRLKPEDFQPVQHIQRVEVQADGFSVVVEPGQSDPIMRMDLDLAVRARISAFPPWVVFALRWLAFFGALLIVGWLVQRLWAHVAPPLARILARHPVASLAVVSALSVAVQCHPVVFLGKSFVSPDIGAYLLYEGFPTLPGFTTGTLEDAKGSDTGAVFYHHLHAPKLIRDALFRDGELPLWNRYTMCGVPALGQGQLMLGEPLSLPAVLAGGESWAWDLRYVLARWLFGFGSAVAVWLLTRDRLSAVVIAATAVFVGYFSFRLNHPAQFSLAASPWILVAWLGLSTANVGRQFAVCGIGVCVANWCVHASGTVKEAITLMFCLNLTGALLVALDRAPLRLRLRRLGEAGFWGLTYVLVTAPLWMTFLGTLDRAYSPHQAAVVLQSRPSLIAGFFEDMLIRAMWPGEPQAMPAANLVVLLGLGWAAVCFRDLVRSRCMLALGLGFGGAAAVAYGLVPASWIARIPLLANIQHVSNTFSCAMIVIGLVLAGGGIQVMATRALGARWRRDALRFAGIVAGLGALYGSLGAPQSFSPFFKVYVIALIAALVTVLLAVGSARFRRSPGLLTVLLAGAAVVLLWRHGTYVHTPFDAYVVNPKVRAAFHVSSPSVDFINDRLHEPSRPNGIRYNLFSGFNAMLGWEGIYGVDPLRNGYFDEFARAGGVLKLFWGMGVGDWSQWNEEKSATLQPVLDAMNVRFHLATPGTPAERMEGLLGRFNGDFDIYESESAWPRAFFSRHLWAYDSVDEWVDRVKSSPPGRPIAAIQATDVAALDLPSGVLVSGPGEPTSSCAAEGYRLTTNTTSFRVRADGPGVIVLSEGYFPHDFRAYLNGSRVGYFRANHAFKGIAVSAAGVHEIRFEYWPREMTTALWMAAAGLVLACGGVTWTVICASGGDPVRVTGESAGA